MPRPFSETLTSFFWTSLPTTWISTPSSGLRSSLSISKTLSSSYPTTVTSSIRFVQTLRISITARSQYLQETTTSGSNLHSLSSASRRKLTVRRKRRSRSCRNSSSVSLPMLQSQSRQLPVSVPSRRSSLILLSHLQDSILTSYLSQTVRSAMTFLRLRILQRPSTA